MGIPTFNIFRREGAAVGEAERRGTFGSTTKLPRDYNEYFDVAGLTVPREGEETTDAAHPVSPIPRRVAANQQPPPEVATLDTGARLSIGEAGQSRRAREVGSPKKNISMKLFKKDREGEWGKLAGSEVTCPKEDDEASAYYSVGERI